MERSNALVESFLSYRLSKDPIRFMYYGRDGVWKDFPAQKLEYLRTCYMQGNTSVFLSWEGRTSVVEFLRMSQTDPVTGAVRSIAWVDSEGRFFSPRRTLGRVDSPEVIECHRCSDSEEEEEEVFSGELSCERRRWDGAEAVSCDEEYYKIMVKTFLNGARNVDPGVTVSSISRCSFDSPVKDGKRRAFWTMVEATKAVRGNANANLTFGWYSATEEELNRILQYGFGESDVEVSDEEVFGRGVRFAQPPFLHRICGSSEADQSGKRHVLLCRIIAGVTEKVERGSDQCYPSSKEFDSGVDEHQNPKWCIVWSTHMNTHVLPECIVSFKFSSNVHAQGPLPLRKRATSKKSFCPSNMTFKHLLVELGKSLHPSAVRTIGLLFERYKAKKLPKDVFAIQLRDCR